MNKLLLLLLLPKTSQTAATTPMGTAEILSTHINDTQTSTYSTTIGDSNVKALFDSGATLSCISKQCYERICTREPNQIINATMAPPHDNHVCIQQRTHKSRTMLTLLQIRGGNFRVLLPNNQKLKARSYTRPQLPENVQNITRHNRFK